MNTQVLKKWDFGKVRLIENLICVQTKWVSRSWRERWFSFPWKPFKKMKPILIPLERVFITKEKDGIKTYIGHPIVIEKLKQEMIKALVK